MTASVARGRCLCETVVFEAALPSRWCAHCHCSMCRRAHGAGFVTWVGVDASGFRLSAGEEAFARYASSPGAERGFCRRCGSSFYFRSDRWPGEVHLTLANFDGEIDRAPEINAFADDRAHWIDLPRIDAPDDST